MTPRSLARWLARSQRRLQGRLIRPSTFLVLSFFRRSYRLLNTFIPMVALLALGLIIYDFGYHPFYSQHATTYRWLDICLWIIKITVLLRFLFEWTERLHWRAHLFSFLLVIFCFYLHTAADSVVESTSVGTAYFRSTKMILYAGIIFIAISEAAQLLRFAYRRITNPSFFFVISFAAIILLGSLLLLLPQATTRPISFVEALFTSASAVCITGLTVVDTATHFTTLGHIILLGLIQAGGLGIMSFAVLLAYLSAGSVSVTSQMALKDILASKQISNVMAIITQILLVTFVFEAIGVVGIYFSLNPASFSSSFDQLFFSVFHAVSAFCNAGFSTYSTGLFDPAVRFNYNFQWVLIFLILLGGLGFPITFNLFTFFKSRVRQLLLPILKIPVQIENARILQVQSKLALVTSALLLGVGFLCYLLFEQQASLTEHPTLYGKLVTSLFGAVTPRTAGFNTVSMGLLSQPMIMIYLLLMFIGASPLSTGGGIKTTTAAVAFLNIRAVILGKSRTTAFMTEIAPASIQRSFAVILASLLALGLIILALSISDGHVGLLKIAFEAFSAFCTVGLSLGITPELSEASKVILVVAMFMGRVGILTLLLAVAPPARTELVRYPMEDVTF